MYFNISIFFHIEFILFLFHLFFRNSHFLEFFSLLFYCCYLFAFFRFLYTLFPLLPFSLFFLIFFWPLCFLIFFYVKFKTLSFIQHLSNTNTMVDHAEMRTASFSCYFLLVLKDPYIIENGRNLKFKNDKKKEKRGRSLQNSKIQYFA